MPALGWVAQEHGADFAVHSDTGSAAACTRASPFAAAFVMLSRRHGQWTSLVVAVVSGGLA